MLDKFLKNRRKKVLAEEPVVDSVLVTKASEELQKEIDEELEKEDPEKGIAKSIMDF